jgi:hypothetical protein
LLRNHKTAYDDVNETRKIVTALIETTNYDKSQKSENQQSHKLSIVAVVNKKAVVGLSYF